MSGWNASPRLALTLTLLAWSDKALTRLGEPWRDRSPVVRLSTFDGTWSRSMPSPGSGLVRTASTVGSTIICGGAARLEPAGAVCAGGVWAAATADHSNTIAPATASLPRPAIASPAKFFAAVTIKT
jgi:hypothetical protein